MTDCTIRRGYYMRRRRSIESLGRSSIRPFSSCHCFRIDQLKLHGVAPTCGSAQHLSFHEMDTKATRSEPSKSGRLSALFLLATVSKLTNAKCMISPRPLAFHSTLPFMKWTHRPRDLTPQRQVDYPPFFFLGLFQNWLTQIA